MKREISSLLPLAAKAALIAPLFAIGFVTNAAAANDSAQDGSSKLRICAAADELPYSSRDKSGFENKIAEVVADAMGRKAEFVWFPKAAIYIVRDQLDVKACDVVMGIDTGDTRVLTTKPYYRGAYVFIQRKDTKLDITSWSSPDLMKADKIGFTPGSPAQTMLEKIGLFRDNFNYMHSLTNFQDRRNRFTRIPPARMVNEVADGTASVSVNFAPEVARYAKAAGNIKLTVIPDDNVRSDGEKVPHHFDQSLGVRKDDKELVAALDAALDKAKPKIEEILKDEGIPLVTGLPRS
ncbi:MAG: methanol oxidation system protein MoxJ [Hyphomicrobium sp.]|jgi:mxaJ protein